MLQGRMDTLDLRGLKCPLPVLKANKALRALPAGAELALVATDPAAESDFPAFAQETGHTLLAMEKRDGELHIRLRKRG